MKNSKRPGDSEKIRHMKAKKWHWKIDQWFENKVWTKIPQVEQSPHLFFICGCWFGGGFIIILYTILTMLST